MARRRDAFAPVGLYVDVLYEVRKAMRALRRAQRSLEAEIRQRKKEVKRASS